MNGESTSMVWPTVGSRTAKEQEQAVTLLVGRQEGHPACRARARVSPCDARSRSLVGQ